MPAASRSTKGKNLKTSPLADQTSNGSSRPADECPWPRPFPEGFDQCPIYAARPYRATDSRDRPLPPVLTCLYLISRPFDQPKAGWYGACEIGDAAERRAYLERKIVAIVKPIL
jgi:hypothetical protein